MDEVEPVVVHGDGGYGFEKELRFELAGDRFEVIVNHLRTRLVVPNIIDTRAYQDYVRLFDRFPMLLDIPEVE